MICSFGCTTNQSRGSSGDLDTTGIDEAIVEANKTPVEYLVYCNPPTTSKDDLKSSILITRDTSTANHYECYRRLKILVDYIKRKEVVE